MNTYLFHVRWIGAATIFVLLTGLSSVRAALIWNADFESYNTSGGAVALTVNSTGAYDTFTSTTSANMTSVITDVRAASSIAPGATNLTGNALYLSGTNTTGASASASVRLFQKAITSLDSGKGVLVVSFDLWNIDRTETVPIDASTTTGRYGSTISMASIAVTKSYRVTLVINRTGQAVTLPDAAGTVLATDSIASYWYDGTTYSTASTNAGGFSSTVAGFGIGESLSSLANNASLTTAFDNFGAWNSLDDTVNGVSILSLAPGTAVPEPSAAALLGLSIAMAVIAARRRTRRSVG